MGLFGNDQPNWDGEKWDYETWMVTNRKMTEEQLNSKLKEMGDEGWELVDVEGVMGKRYFIFKRPRSSDN